MGLGRPNGHETPLAVSANRQVDASLTPDMEKRLRNLVYGILVDYMKIPRWIRESNLIEGVDDRDADHQCLLAWQWFLEQPMGLDTILSLHKRVMAGRLPITYLGVWRPVDVTVGGRLCPPWEEVPRLMQDWLERFRMANGEIQPVIAHVAFENVHPFVDGNGRVGRMIMNWQRALSYRKPMTILYNERWEYYGWFR